MSHRDNLYAVRAGGDLATALYQRGQSVESLARAQQNPQTLKTSRRLLLTQVLFVLAFATLAMRLAGLTLEDTNQPIASTQIQKQETPRAIIKDRNNVILATQINMSILGADAAAIDNPEAVVAQLQSIVPDINMPRTLRLLSGKSRYVILQRGLTPQQHQQILHLGNPSLQLRIAPHRVYPLGSIAAHITGFVEADMQNGLSGIEHTLDRIDTTQQFTTTLDIRVQHIVRDALLSAMAEYKAKASAAAIINIHNGEVIALVSLPDFDANNPQASPTLNQFNRMTYGVYELGSIFKIFTAAMALESGAVNAAETFQTSQPLSIGGHQINDPHGQNRPLTIDEIVIHSSNIGSALLALRVPSETHYNFLTDLSFTQRLDFDLPETARPLFPARWTDIERATSSYGHGLAVTPLHALMATAAMVNGGVLYPPSLRPVDIAIGRRVISAETSAHLRRMMRDVVVEGTGKQAAVSGYPIMGKTGSANKPQGGQYSDDALVASFVGAFPADNPRYALLVMLDEPQGIEATFGHALAGWNAAPVASEIISRAALFLGVLPSQINPQAQMIGGDNAS